MEIRSDRRHHFDIGVDELWPKLVQTEHYRTWWPWLRSFDAEAFAVGERWRCRVQPPLPYSLQFEVVLTEVEAARRVTAAVEGDIFGTASIELTPNDAGCELHLVSQLGPANRVLRTIARVARPMVGFGHDWVLDTGLRQFRSRAL